MASNTNKNSGTSSNVQGKPSQGPGIKSTSGVSTSGVSMKSKASGRGIVIRDGACHSKSNFFYDLECQRP